MKPLSLGATNRALSVPQKPREAEGLTHAARLSPPPLTRPGLVGAYRHRRFWWGAPVRCSDAPCGRVLARDQMHTVVTMVAAEQACRAGLPVWGWD